MTDTKALSFQFDFLRESLSLSRGWEAGCWNGKRSLRAPYGGNEVRFRIQDSPWARLTLAVDAWVWVHVFVDDNHQAAIPPESDPAVVALPLNAETGSEIRIVRTAVSSGPFFVDAHLIELEMARGGRILPSARPLPSEVFSTFGDSISGNCCINPEPPFDPYGLGYGWEVCRHFGWQYLNPARDGSGFCRPLFGNPLAWERVERDVLVHRPDYLLMFYGTNDMGAGVGLEDEFAPAYERIAQILVERLPETRLACLALLWRHDVPVERIRDYNRAIMGICGRHGIPCRDPFDWVPPEFFHDGIHPTREGQRRIAAEVIQFFESVFSELKDSSGVAP